MIDLKIWNVSNKLSPNYSHEPNPLSKHECQTERFYFVSENTLGILHCGYIKPVKTRNFAECQNQKRSAAFHTIQTRGVQYSDSYEGMAVDPKVKIFLNSHGSY